MKFLKLSSGGRITVPAALREKYNLQPGARVRFIEEKDGIKILPLVTAEEIKANVGFLGTKGKLLKSLREEKRREKEL